MRRYRRRFLVNKMRGAARRDWPVVVGYARCSYGIATAVSRHYRGDSPYERRRHIEHQAIFRRIFIDCIIIAARRRPAMLNLVENFSW